MNLTDFLKAEAKADGLTGKVVLELMYGDDLAKYLQDPDLVLSEWSINPAEWSVQEVQIKVGEKAGLVATIQRRLVTDAKPSWLTYRPNARRSATDGDYIVVALGDYQAPTHDLWLH